MSSTPLRFNRILALAFILLAASAAISQSEQDASSERPRNPGAGRVRTLTPILTITDKDGSAFFFKSPFNPQFGPDGSIYVLDEEQLLRFDAQGQFVRNYYRKGQGPGEFSFITGYSATATGLIVHNMSPGKIVRYDPEGAYLGEASIAAAGYPLFLVRADGHNAFFLKTSGLDREKIAAVNGQEATIESKNPILAIPVQGGPAQAVGSFSTWTYVRKSKEGGAGMVPMGKYLITPWGDGFLAISDTEEYAVKILDADTGSVIRTLRRLYPRVETPPEDRNGISGGAMIDGKAVKRPAGKYTADIVHLLARGEELWVVTSTRVKGKGVLVDVFNREGAFMDSFYLPIPAWPEQHLTRPDPLALRGDFLLTLEKTEEGTYLIREYRLGK